MADDIDLKIDETVDSMIGDILPGSEPAPVEETIDKGSSPAVTSLAKPATPGDPNAPIEYPKSWKQDYATEWPKIPRPLQEYITGTREKDYLNGLEQYKAGHTSWNEMNSVISPYMPRLTSLNMQPAQAIKSLLNADWALSQGTPEQKYEMLASICSTYGLDPTKISAGGEQPYQTEEAKALAKRLSETENTMRSFMGSQVAAQRAAIDNEVATFAADPAHPHFNEVGDHIARLIGADKNLSLKDAYEAAVWANPTTRAKEMERLNKERTDSDRKAREEAARKARLASAANIRGRPTDKTTGAAKGGWEDELPVTAAKIKATH